MELPSMVQRSGDTLIVRSVVSGNQLYMDQTGAGANNKNRNESTNSMLGPPSQHLPTKALEHQLECYRAAAAAAAAQQHHFLQQQQQQQQQQNVASSSSSSLSPPQSSALDLKDEGLPQCKIKRNYSCSYCTYFTQNPRCHLQHLRDVHGEKIVINKCQLCLYASRHFQKLVRHMKMVHGCTDGVSSGHGQARGKRGMSREARKRKLEQSVGVGVTEMPTLEQVKRELELQEQKLQHTLNKQQDEQKHRSLNADAYLAYERSFHAAQRERDLEMLKMRGAANSNNNNQYETDLNAERVPQPSPLSNFQLSNRHLEQTPSPLGSNSPASAHVTADDDVSPPSTSYSDEPSHNRLLKCSICDFTTLYRDMLLEHEMEEHQKTKFFRCNKCSYVTHIKARFSKHVKYHSMPMIKCVTCDFRTPYKWNLDRHMKNHGGAGPFKCAACDFTADIKQSLTVHEMNHHVPPVGHAAGMSLARRRNKVGGTDLSDDFLSDSAELMEDHFNNNNLDIEYDEMVSPADIYGKRGKYEEDEPTDLSAKGGSSDTSSVHNHSLAAATATTKAKRPLPNLIPLPKGANSILNLSKDLAASRSSLTEIASMFFNEKQVSEMLQPMDKSDAAQLSPTLTINSTTSSHNSRNLLHKKNLPPGNFFDKLKSSALTSGGPNENLICSCGHTAKCLSEFIIHRKTCAVASIATDDDEEQEDEDGRLEIDFADDEDKQSHSALNLSLTGSTRCQHCRHRCKSSVDLINHLKQCSEAGRCGNESYDSMSGDSCGKGAGLDMDHHPMENRVFIWNKMPRGGDGNGEAGAASNADGDDQQHNSGNNATSAASTEENSYYGVETAPGYGEVTKKMTPEEEAANSSLKKVYKCPHCSFWASTASRFHVHIVGHLNKKPFECSLCSYRSNWRWDITKHIRLKTIRDPSHKNARVLMNDETGRRNYTKYNKYITLMKVTEEDGDPKLMKSGEMTPNQVASLSFLNDFKGNGSSGTAGAAVSLNIGSDKNEVTLEPLMPKGSDAVDGVQHAQLSEELMRLPILASMMNAALVQQQQQQQQQHQKEQDPHATLITPSVTISAVKRTPPPLMKPSDDLITDVRQEGNEKKTYYKCRKCSFRHLNRDAVLAHVKIHYQDANYPIVTATATTSPKTAHNAASNSSSLNTPLQVSVNPNLYMNKVFAAMCLQQPASAGLLQQAIQGANSSLSGLALALAGKSPSKLNNVTAASILEHGEQKAAILNEASAQVTPTSPLKTSANATATAAAYGYGHSSNSLASGVGVGLQQLLKSPSQQQQSQQQQLLNNSTVTNTKAQTHNQNIINNNLVKASNNNNNNSPANNKSTNKFQQPQQQLQKSPSASISSTTTTTTTTFSSNTSPSSTSTIVNTSLSCSSTSNSPSNGHGVGHGFVHNNQAIENSNQSIHNQNSHSNNNNGMGIGLLMGGGVGDNVCMGGVLYATQNLNNNHNNSSNNSHLKTVNGNLNSNSHATSQTCHSNNSNLLLCSPSAKTAVAAAASTPPSSSSSYNINSNLNQNNTNSTTTTLSNNQNNNNLLSNDGDRRDPSPYRCGHCHQVSNWKHVIQRHCRLKHGGDIRIETLDRVACHDRSATAGPLYRPLGNASAVSTQNEVNNYSLNMKQTQQQQQQQNLNNNNSVLMNTKNETASSSNSNQQHLLHSPLAAATAAAAANAANTPHDIQAAAAAYLAAAYKVATAAAGGAGSLNGNDLMLQQQLQHNDQIEITRLPSSNSISNASNLAQLLDAAAGLPQQQQPQQQQQQQNSKCKQQKCPVCPYISESKSQMNYHISLHKPTQYECPLCTFVCAKKQHLSGHMRSVHQQQPSSNQQQQQMLSQNVGVANNLNSAMGGLDFSVALQLAAAAQQEVSSSPLAIDLTALKGSFSNERLNSSRQSTPNQHHLARAATHSPQQLPPEYQYKMISFCPKCPARFAQKHSTSSGRSEEAKTELMEHKQAHHGINSNEEAIAYSCEFCDFTAAHETLIQAHRYAHTQQYQDKFNVLYKNCKEDAENPAPKLMQITSTKGSGEVMWVVDNELSQQQHCNISSSSSCSGYDNGNSLLKKQLEAGARNTPSPKNVENNEEDSKNTSLTEAEAEESLNNPSTSASVATSDLAAEAASELEAELEDSPALKEKCLHCPFESCQVEKYKAHLQHHYCVSNRKEAHNCEHCDYSHASEKHLEEHTRLHFNAMEKLKSVAYFTSYDQLELSVEQEDEEMPNNNKEMPQRSAVHIKQEQEQEALEHNNNNEENAINENMVAVENKSKNFESSSSSSTNEPHESPSSPKKTCTKIILYKNDGCLSIKRDANAASCSATNTSNPNNSNNNNNNTSNNLNNLGDNISDRLRRRISRNTNSQHVNGAEEQTQTHHHSSSSHKTILVNAKTGQVISRN